MVWESNITGWIFVNLEFNVCLLRGRIFWQSHPFKARLIVTIAASTTRILVMGEINIAILIMIGINIIAIIIIILIR